MRIPNDVRLAVLARDGRCIGPRIGMPGRCGGVSEQDHIHTGGLGLKGPATVGNIVRLCTVHHRLKTDHGKTWRPLLDRYVAS